MEFEYQSSIWVSEDELDRIAKRVASGKGFYAVFDAVMACHGDDEYYNCGLIADAVEKEVMRRVTNGKD